ncbi:Similar to hypothetical protein [Tuber melanosporum Mel28]; acc. no. XP_002835255 [Pyronema omphalodes CBS 100304]|uniref:Uncharacterized protein n=1 Tax=Pyronema omphalodes (strain CBS 100304) TaxID=1076935 RepID=U4L808_PYROM|nr:Similar to hypothetical protein [Tuber melanosporum Mel28]; acc. no. XP_002835255 [Pyronema omphalodes CBS 100304]
MAYYPPSHTAGSPPAPLTPWFLDGEGIEHRVVQSDIPRYLGNDATVKRGQRDAMVRSLKDDSERYNNERRETRRRQGQDEVDYHVSKTFYDSLRRPIHEQAPMPSQNSAIELPSSREPPINPVYGFPPPSQYPSGYSSGYPPHPGDQYAQHTNPSSSREPSYQQPPIPYGRGGTNGRGRHEGAPIGNYTTQAAGNPYPSQPIQGGSRPTDGYSAPIDPRYSGDVYVPTVEPVAVPYGARNTPPGHQAGHQSGHHSGHQIGHQSGYQSGHQNEDTYHYEAEHGSWRGNREAPQSYGRGHARHGDPQ